MGNERARVAGAGPSSLPRQSERSDGFVLHRHMPVSRWSAVFLNMDEHQPPSRLLSALSFTGYGVFVDMDELVARSVLPSDMDRHLGRAGLHAFDAKRRKSHHDPVGDKGAAVIALPFAAFITLPFAWVYAIFQNADVFATTSDLSAAWRKSREQAFLWPKQNWQLLACASLLATIIFVNVMLSFLFGAQLLHSVLGVQTALTRSRFAFLNSTLIGVAAAISYLAVNPILKAAYVIRCFEGESLHTGADLRLVLRRASILVVLLFSIHAPSEAAPVQQYDQAIDSVLRRPEYSWRLPKPKKVNSSGAIAQVVTAAGDWAERIAKSILEFLARCPRSRRTMQARPAVPGRCDGRLSLSPLSLSPASDSSSSGSAGVRRRPPWSKASRWLSLST